MGLLQAQKRRDDAFAAVRAAKSDADAKKAAAEYEAATLALATLQAKSSKKDDEPKKPLAEEEEEEEDEEHEEEEEDDEEEEEEESDDDKDDDSDDDSDDDDDDDDSEEEEEEEEERCKEKALASAKSLVKSAKSASAKAAAKAHLTAVKSAIAPKSAARAKALREAVARVTGRKSHKAMLAALDVMSGKAKAADTLRANRKSDRINALITKAQSEGRVQPSQVKTLRKMSARELKSFLATLPKQVRTVEDGGLQGRSQSGNTDGEQPTDRQALYDAQKLTAEQRKMLEPQALAAGKSVEDFVKDLNATIEKRANSAARN